jgi:hypothetical protein
MSLTEIVVPTILSVAEEQTPSTVRVEMIRLHYPMLRVMEPQSLVAVVEMMLSIFPQMTWGQ